MPRITLEKKESISNNVFKITEEVYEIPNNVVYKGEFLSYDSYHQEYTNKKDLSVSAIDYLKCVLAKAKKAEQNKSKTTDDLKM